MSETINVVLPDPPKGPCANCGKNPGTKIWSGDMGTAMAVRVGLSRMPLWCELCVATAQLAHARERAAAIPELVKTIERLSAAQATQDDPHADGDYSKLCSNEYCRCRQ